jgi:hypothetical protein
MHYNKLIAGILLGFFWNLPVFATREVLQPFQCQPVSSPENELKLCVLNLSEDEAQWFILKEARLSERIPVAPQSLSTVDDFQISPTQSFLAIVSVGEGHPILDVVDLKRLLEHKIVKSLLSINPYPGLIHIEKWQKEQLIVVTDRLLTYSTSTETEKSYPLGLSEGEKFALEIATGKITPLTPHARNPIRFYSQQLYNSHQWEVTEAITALVSLQADKAIPILQQALKHHQNTEIKKALREAIEKLTP